MRPFMPHHEFQIDPALCRLLLNAQGDSLARLNELPDNAFSTTAQEAGARVAACVADLGYRKQHDRASVCDRPDHDGHTPGSRYPIARIQNGQCAWMDPGLAQMLSHDFDLDLQKKAALLGAMLVQFYAHVLKQGFQGDFGAARASVDSGELSIDIAHPA